MLKGWSLATSFHLNLSLMIIVYCCCCAPCNDQLNVLMVVVVVGLCRPDGHLPPFDSPLTRLLAYFARSRFPFEPRKTQVARIWKRFSDRKDDQYGFPHLPETCSSCDVPLSESNEVLSECSDWKGPPPGKNVPNPSTSLFSYKTPCEKDNRLQSNQFWPFVLFSYSHQFLER